MKRFTAVAMLSACVVMLVSLSSAQEASQPMRLQVSTAVERTPELMDAFDATAAMPAPRTAEFRPTIDASQYALMKQAAAMAPMGKPGTSAPTAPLAALSLGFTGATECDGPGGCWVPPDVAGSIGKTQFVSVNNNVFEVRSRSGSLLKTNSLNGLCGGYSVQPMFDPRVQWDEAWQRWVITAIAFPVNNTSTNNDQEFCIAISKTGSATGAFWVYLMNVNSFGGLGSFYDFPMLGLADNAALFSANIFGVSAFQGSSLFAVEKSRLYNGLGFSVPLYLHLNATLQPPHQAFTDQNPCAWLAAATGSGSISMYKLCNPGTFSATLTGPIAVSGVPAYAVPPSAAQPSSCSGATLDSSDTRFVNAATQNGDSYYQVHTVALAGFPAPRYYVITGLSASTPTVSVSNLVFASSTSFDFNASIASDSNGNFGINWSYTDPANNVLPSVRFTDNNGGNPANSTGINAFTSASCYNSGAPARWGDYSQTTADPGSGTTASGSTKVFWINNETVPSANFWSTRISKMKF